MGAELAIKTRWPRLLSEPDAAEYLSVSRTTLRALEIRARRIGRRVLYDVRDLDRWVDRMGEQPIAHADVAEAMADEERRFFERRAKRGEH